jgi:arylsulfatase A-like enzyme
LLVGVVVCAALGACVPNAPPKISAPPGAASQPWGLIIWIDAFDGPTVKRMLSQGQLPNISRWIIQRGVTVNNAVASYPTITYANNVSFLTGMFPGHHGVTDNRWFDRDSLLLRDYTFVKFYQRAAEDFQDRTIFQFTATILTPIRRGATRPIDNWISSGVSWFFGYQDTVNHLTTLRFELLSDVAKRDGRWPGLVLAYFVTPDTVCHHKGVGSPEYAHILKDVDEQIGHICQSLQAAGLLENCTLTLVTDHGMQPTPRTCDTLDYFCKTLKVPSLSDDYGAFDSYEKRLKHFSPARAVVVASGKRRCAISLRCAERWGIRPTEQEIDEFAARFADPSAKGGGKSLPELLVDRPGTDLLVVRRGPNSVRVQSAAGTGVIERSLTEGRKMYRYRVTAGKDPLDYTGTPAAALCGEEAYHSAEEWFAATLNSPRPDAVVQLIELNDSPRAGDLALYARSGWAWRRGNQGGHGGLLREEVIVPWYWAGPGLPAGTTIDGARTVDLAPTILELLGHGDRTPANLDGRSIAQRLRAAQRTN